MKPFGREDLNYALWGALFGLCFPVLGTILETYSTQGEVSLPMLLQLHKSSPLLLIIDTAPFFLGLFAYFIGKHVDTLRTKNEQIIKAQEQRQEQMATIGQMTAGIAHEIKNPLNFVTNFSESSIEIADDLTNSLLCSDKIEERDLTMMKEMIMDLKQNARDVLENGNRANRIVMTLMDHMRQDAGDKQWVNINELVDENLNLAYQGYRANHPSFNVDLQRHYTDDIQAIKINPQSVGRVILNILNNAMQALDERRLVDGNGYLPTLMVATRSREESVEIDIRDNGRGIPDHLREKIFEPFFTTKPVGKGNTGLGLAISLDIISQEHGGSLELESQEGKYTAFKVRLPGS